MDEILEELSIGSLRARNRLVRAATAESLCTREGAPTFRLNTLYGELADGGVGIIITGYAYVTRDGKPSERSMNIAENAFADEYRALVERVHEGGGSVVLQLVYGGSKSKLASDDPRRISMPPASGTASVDGAASDSAAEPEDASPAFAPAVPNANIVGPSAVGNPATGIVPRAATEIDLMRIRKAFADAAQRAKSYGFDGVEVHAAHGYLLSQFLDARFNHRDDEYGGSLENRARFAVECVQAVRNRVGDSFPVFVKLNACDVADDPQGTAGGLSEEESLQVAQMLVKAGASAIEVSGDWHAFAADEVDGEPFFGAFGTRLARHLDVPVIVTGGWRDPAVMQRYLQTTDIASIGMGRPFINEPFLLRRWEENNQRPAHCISCNFCTRQMGIPCINRR